MHYSPLSLLDYSVVVSVSPDALDNYSVFCLHLGSFYGLSKNLVCAYYVVEQILPG